MRSHPLPHDETRFRTFPPGPMLRQILESKPHRAMITDADVDYKGSIEIPRDLMDAADPRPGEQALVASISTGARLETYVLEGKPGTGRILNNAVAAHLIRAGERTTIMALATTDRPVDPTVILLNDSNDIIRTGRWGDGSAPRETTWAREQETR